MPHHDDPATMARMRSWLATVSQELELDPHLIEEAEQPLLNMVSSVAHGPSRPAAPLTAFLVGVAAGGGRDAAQLAGEIAALAEGQTPQS